MSTTVQKNVTIIGGGVAGMESAGQLASMGFKVTLLEKENSLGGNISNWHHIFPDGSSAKKLVAQLKSLVQTKVDVKLEVVMNTCLSENNSFKLELSNGETLNSDALVVTTGFDIFKANEKEEYGYGIYENVITSADLEEKFSLGQPIMTNNGLVPKRIAFIHCVGSRDEKTGNTYCSKVCCATALKQAIEIKKLLPFCEVFCFYMDLRMFDRYFEDIYYEAQIKYGIKFIRGRLSEACENKEHNLLLKAEDTLTGRPLKMNVDIMVLMTGMVVSKGTSHIAAILSIDSDKDKFLKTEDNHRLLNLTSQKGVFVAGTCTGPKTIAETIADARSAAIQVSNYLQSLN